MESDHGHVSKDSKLISYMVIIYHKSANYCPKGILCGRRLKTCVRECVRRRRRRLANRFSGVLPLCSSTPYTFFGWHSQGIRNQLKSVDPSVLQKHTDVAHQEICQKHTFWIKNPRLANGRSFKKRVFWIHFVSVFSRFCQLFQALCTQNDLRATLALRV